VTIAAEQAAALDLRDPAEPFELDQFACLLELREVLFETSVG
jgi:hypothetical protein